MATYKNIKGSRIRVVAADPSPVDAGDTWYNSTTNVIKYQSAGSFWTETSDVNEGRWESGGCGTTTEAAMTWSGQPGPYTGNTETFNGTSWSEVNEAGTGRFACTKGIGTTTAALFAGAGTGPQPQGVNLSEEWNGTSWAEGNEMITARVLMAGFGTQTAAVSTGGYNSCIGTTDLGTEEYDGTTWSAATAMNKVRRAAGTGIIAPNTAGIVFSGTAFIGGGQNLTEEYNGSAWTEVADLSETHDGCAGAGNQTAAVAAGGPSYSANVEDWNGSTWSTGNDINLGRNQPEGAGAGSSALCISGESASVTPTTYVEEYAAGGQTKTITAT